MRINAPALAAALAAVIFGVIVLVTNEDATVDQLPTASAEPLGGDSTEARPAVDPVVAYRSQVYLAGAVAESARAPLDATESSRSPGQADAGAIAVPDSLEHSSGRFEVRFTRESVTDTNLAGVVLVASTDGDGEQVSPMTVTANGAICSLEDGEYVAALHLAGVGVGPVSGFTVAGGPMTIRLKPVTLLDGRARIVDYDSLAPVGGATVVMRRVDLAESWPTAAAGTMTADFAGAVEFRGVPAGRWQLRAFHAGYDQTDASYELPGAFASPVLGDHMVDLGSIDLPRLQPFLFQLVEHDAWSDLTEFALSHTHSGERVPFDSAGAAALNLGWYNMPLYIKLYYPDGRDSVIFLEAGVPLAGEPHELEVGGGGGLEVDVRLSRDVEEALAGKDAWVNVSYRTRNGDSNKLGLRMAGEDTYTFDSVQASEAIVSIEVVDGPTTTKWRSQWVDLKADERTTCSLYVDGPPFELVVIDGNENPIAGFTCEVRQLPAETSWITGGTSDATGRIRLARVMNHTCSLSGFSSDNGVVAIDVDVDLGGQEGRAILQLSPTEDTFVEVTVNGSPLPGVYVEWVGIHSVSPYVVRETNDVGRTASVSLLTSSRVQIRLDAPRFWVPFRSVELRPGRNAIQVHEVGFIEAPDGVDLGAVVSVHHGASVQQWIDTGLATFVEQESGLRSVRVPVGVYRVRIGAPEETQVVVTAGRTVRVSQ